ncbi:unnamed protein product, partial [Prorocentrum cordatum]
GCADLPALRRREAVALHRLRSHRSQVSQAVARDLDGWAAQVALEAQAAADANDSGALHSIARRLRSGHDRAERCRVHPRRFPSSCLFGPLVRRSAAEGGAAPGRKATGPDGLGPAVWKAG